MLREKYKRASGVGDIQLIREIVLELNGLDAIQKKEFRDLYVQIGNDLFDQNTTLANYDLDAYDGDINNGKKKLVKEKPNKGKPEKVFDDVFCEFFNRSHDIFPVLKYHFLFQVGSSSTGDIRFLVVTDARFRDNPLIDKIIELNANLAPDQFTLEELEERILTSSDDFPGEALILLAISPTVGPNSEYAILRRLIPKLSNCSIINLHKPCDVGRADYSYRKISAMELDKIEKITTNFLNNKAISHEEEKIIKLLLTKNLNITDYTILKAGFSGSKVIEVRPVRNLPSATPIRSIIKFALRTGESKLYAEKEAFKVFLDELRVDGYACEYAESELCEGIRYNYASADSRADSHSFSALLDDFVSGDPRLNHKLDQTLDDLFNCAPFRHWAGVIPVERSVETMYSRYLNADKVFSVIALLENRPLSRLELDNIFKYFQNIVSLVLRANEKICHGDLHSENFFKDEKNVYLIDFGYTGRYHAVLDHSTLEASIKFKHIPFYIPIQEMLDIEAKLFDANSFSGNFDLSFISRPVLRELFSIVLKVRRDALRYMRTPNNPVEYFISLFIMSFRQIQYKDLNQRYAFESTKLLGQFILSKLQ